jgi:hypothetical protein
VLTAKKPLTPKLHLKEVIQNVVLKLPCFGELVTKRFISTLIAFTSILKTGLVV